MPFLTIFHTFLFFCLEYRIVDATDKEALNKDLPDDIGEAKT